MEAREVVHRIEQALGKAVVSAADEGQFPHVTVEPGSLKNLMSYCLHDPDLRFDFLECLSGSDNGQDLAVIYQLFSTVFGHRVNIKSLVSRHDPKIPSATGFWGAANAYEREAAEMFGIDFEGHPSPARLLLPEDWQGYPLRKDYVYPEEYHGIEHRRDPLRKEHVKP